MILTSTEIVCPRGTPGESPLVIDLAAILKAEVRQEETSSVTPAKAQELSTAFNRSWLDLNGVLAHLHLEKMKAEKVLEQRRSVLMLEVVPKTLSDKKLQSNDANREAIVLLDEDYSAKQDTLMEIVAVVKFLEGKLRSFENALSIAKKVLGDQSPMWRTHNPNLSGDTSSKTAPGVMTEQQRQLEPRKGFGKSRFGS